jgi:hypothetical protein
MPYFIDDRLRCIMCNTVHMAEAYDACAIALAKWHDAEFLFDGPADVGWVDAVTRDQYYARI